MFWFARCLLRKSTPSFCNSIPVTLIFNKLESAKKEMSLELENCGCSYTLRHATPIENTCSVSSSHFYALKYNIFSKNVSWLHRRYTVEFYSETDVFSCNIL